MNRRENILENVLLGGLCLCATLLSYLFFQKVLGGLPHVQDEINYVWQGKVFEQLSLTAPRPPVDGVFSYGFQMRQADRIYWIFPPGWPWVLALMGWLRLDRLAPMLLGGLTVLLLFRFARQLAQPSVQEPQPLDLTAQETRALPWLVAILAVLSPAQIVMAGTFMAHSLCLVLSLGFWLSLRRLLMGGGTAYALLAGVTCGLLLTTRPMDAMAACGPGLLWLLVAVLKRQTAFTRLWAVGLPALLFLGALLVHNTALTGSPLTFPQNEYFRFPPAGLEQELLNMRRTDPERLAAYRFSPVCNAPGLGEEVGCVKTFGTFGHTPEKAVKNAWYNLKSLDQNLLGGAGAFVLVLPGLWLLRRRWRWLLPPLLLFPGLYSLYWFHGMAYGARFLHPMVGICLLAVAASLARLSSRLSARLGGLKPAMVTGLLLAALVGWSSRYISALLMEYADDYWCVSPRIREVTQSHVKPGALVLIGHTGNVKQSYALSAMPGSVTNCNNLLRAGSGIALNDPWLKNPIIYGYMPERKEELPLIQQAFPDRTIYFYINNATHGTEELLEVTPRGFEPRFSARFEPNDAELDPRPDNRVPMNIAH